MKINETIRKTILFILAMSTLELSWAASPPNPTVSDNKGNTAGGSGALLFNDTGDSNTGFGDSVLFFNKTGSFNTAIGRFALNSNTSGKNNTACGYSALLANTTGEFNTATGTFALDSNSRGRVNTATGSDALVSNDTGSYNTAAGGGALVGNRKGNSNTAVGAFSLMANQNGSNNIAIGFQALEFAFGNRNIAIGNNAGSKLGFGDNNLYLANPGFDSDFNTIRIGGGHTRTFIAGIRGNNGNTAGIIPVFIDSKGQLGTVNSSARFKKDIHDMADASHSLLKLRPVTYRYKQADESGANPLEYGLIAEEVAKVYPDLVAYGADGKIETVQYQKLTPMMLNEIQLMSRSLADERHKADELRAELKAEQHKSELQAQEIADLKNQVVGLKTHVQMIGALASRLTRLEAQEKVAFNR